MIKLGAQHWGWHGLIAYGAHSYVVVVEPHSLRIVQTLDEHQACVCSVKWYFMFFWRFLDLLLKFLYKGTKRITF